MEDRHFKVERGPEAALLVRLDVERLSKLGQSIERWQQPVPAGFKAAAGAGSSSDAQAAAAAVAAAVIGLQQQVKQQHQLHRPALTVVSSNRLMEFVAGRKWHPSNAFIHAARHHLAVSIISWANRAKFTGPSRGKGAAAAEPARYIVPLATAARWMVRGVKKAMQIDIRPEGTAWVARALAGDPYLVLVAGASSAAHEGKVKLDINNVLWDILNGRDAANSVARAAATAAVEEPGSGGDSGDGTPAAASPVQPDAPTPAAAAAAGAAVDSRLQTATSDAAADELRFGFLQQQRDHATDDDDCISIDSESLSGSVHVGADYVDDFDFDDEPLSLLYRGLTGMPLEDVGTPEGSAAVHGGGRGNSSAVAAAGEAFAAAAASMMPPQQPSAAATQQVAASAAAAGSSSAAALVASHLRPYLSPAPGSPSLLELAADIGRPVRLRLSDGQLVELQDTQLNIQEQVKFLWDFQQSFRQLQQRHGQAAALSTHPTGTSTTSTSSGSDSDPFGPDGCLGVEGALHRIAALRDKSGAITGLSCRGAGKTTLLRDIARLMSLAVEQGGMGLAVMVVDTYCDIAGDAELPHRALGAAGRLAVPQRAQQGAAMLQAVRNHCLDVMVVDEVATAEDVAAARLLAQKGVALVAAAPVSSLSTLLATPELQPLLGVTGGLSPQRSGPAAFSSVLETQQQAR
ncbi:hypothetical protein COO60DRAFT_1639827 [Scenedesmus sp. NREL 46B-D3]|nr:hypothetical protein COO60DRAFT_1639827 [Scenedesmus sp. NREL 46B-D3]